jgi:hypothetical protein
LTRGITPLHQTQTQMMINFKFGWQYWSVKDAQPPYVKELYDIFIHILNYTWVDLRIWDLFINFYSENHVLFINRLVRCKLFLMFFSWLIVLFFWFTPISTQQVSLLMYDIQPKYTIQCRTSVTAMMYMVTIGKRI